MTASSFLALEFIAGPSPQRPNPKVAPARPGKPPRWSKRWRGAVHHAHQQGIIHRDPQAGERPAGNR